MWQPLVTCRPQTPRRVGVAPYGSFGFVNAGAGNDVVCVVPGDALPDYEELASLTVQAGEGDDVIDGTALTPDDASLFVPSSDGRDAFYGGPEQDQATIPAVNGVPPVVDTEADMFVTGGGNDLVMSGSLGVPNPDVIDTGDGDDVVLYAGSRATGEGRVAAAYVDLARGAVVEDRIRLGLNTGRGLLPFGDRLARGGKGRDVLTGTSQRDALFGGGGRDVANGGAGIDLCQTEVRRNCEVR